MNCAHCGRALDAPIDFQVHRCPHCGDESLDMYRPPAGSESALPPRPEVAPPGPSRALAYLTMIGLALLAANNFFDAGNRLGSMGAPNGQETSSAALLLAGIVVFLLTAIAFLLWVHRTSEVLERQRRLKFTPAWAVLWWFVPIAYFYKPYLVMVELWRASDPNSGDDWRFTPRSPILPIWWLCWLGGNFAISIAMRMAFGSLSRQTGDTGAEVEVVGNVMHMTAAVLAVTIVWNIQGRLERLVAKDRKRARSRAKRTAARGKRQSKRTAASTVRPEST